MADKLRIERLYVFIAQAEDGDEGVCGFRTPAGEWIAMVAADKKRVESLKPIARQIARDTGKTIYLECFSVREHLETLYPKTYVVQGQSITCLICGLTSYNRADVATKYCSHCKRFHED